MPSDRSADRHPPGRQPNISARLDRPDYDRLEGHHKRTGVPKRQIIIHAIREFLDRHENREDPK